MKPWPLKLNHPGENCACLIGYLKTIFSLDAFIIYSISLDSIRNRQCTSSKWSCHHNPGQKIRTRVPWHGVLSFKMYVSIHTTTAQPYYNVERNIFDVALRLVQIAYTATRSQA